MQVWSYFEDLFTSVDEKYRQTDLHAPRMLVLGRYGSLCLTEPNARVWLLTAPKYQF
jgi:hypothetical protein